jgi:SPP1 gp7 family putative phage head morphogenesis protein
LFGQVETRAAQWAAEHSAELVTMITDATRDTVQTAIAQAIAQGMTKDEMIDAIMDASTDDPNGAFSEERAQFIAETEVGFANSEGSLMGMKEAEKSGVTLLKEWDATDEPCPICQENQDAGAIPLADAFPSGDMAPLAHPRCRCVLVGVTSD